MRKRVNPSLVISILALIMASTPLADAARHAVGHAIGHMFHTSTVDGHRLSAKPYPEGLLLLGKNKKFPAAAIPTVKNATELEGMSVEVLSSCPPLTVDLGTWCLDSAPYPLNNEQLKENNFFWAAQKCVEEGGFLPSAAELIGAAKRVKLDSTIHDSRLTSTVQEDPTHGLKDLREMSSTLVTTQAGSDAAGSEGISVGSLGNPQLGEPNPVPQPAVPAPETLQYVAVYSNGQKGGFAGSEPVSEPQNFRCGFYKSPGAINQKEK